MGRYCLITMSAIGVNFSTSFSVRLKPSKPVRSAAILKGIWRYGPIASLGISKEAADAGSAPAEAPKGGCPPKDAADENAVEAEVVDAPALGADVPLGGLPRFRFWFSDWIWLAICSNGTDFGIEDTGSCEVETPCADP